MILGIENLQLMYDRLECKKLAYDVACTLYVRRAQIKLQFSPSSCGYAAPFRDLEAYTRKIMLLPEICGHGGVFGQEGTRLPTGVIV